MHKIPFIWTNDDLTLGSYDGAAQMLEFLSQWGLKGTFFVIPLCRDEVVRPLTDDPKLIELLQKAMSAGHEAHQHSVTHHCVENGIADIRMWELMPNHVKIDFSDNRFLLERLWQVDALEAHIGWGRQVWTEAFGSPSAGYRPGCGAFCGNMYTALENLGFKWCSARLASMTGWLWQAGRRDYTLLLEGPVKPFRQGALVEFPILDDVAFRVPPDDVDAFVELGWQLWSECLRNGHPFNLVCHPQGLAYQGGTGYAVHQKLIPRILETGLALPMTLGEYHTRLQSGEFPYAPSGTHYAAADSIPDWHAWSQTPTGRSHS